MTPLEKELVALAKLARPKDIRAHVIYFREKYGAAETTAKLRQAFGEDGADELLDWLLSAQVEPEKPTTPEPAGPVDAIDISAARCKYKGRDVSLSAPITRELKSATIDASAVNFAKVDRDSWPRKVVKKECNGKAWAFWREGGNVVGGPWDWMATGQSRKGLENLHGGILNRVPPKGAEIFVCQASIDGKQRTNVVLAGTWK